MNTKLLCTAALLAAAASTASAAGNAPLTDCVDLGANQEIVRSGGAQSMLLRDGDEHYLVDFRGDCSAVATAISIAIRTDGTANRLCPKGAEVVTDRSNCRIAKVEVIDADQFANLKKRASR
jgi:hypothetical protein